MPVIILFCGLALDVGVLELRQLQMQNAADAAALGAQLEAERGTNNWQVQGQEDAAVNGFTNGATEVVGGVTVTAITVTLAQQPASGPYAGAYDTLQATITDAVPTIFMGALTGGTVTLTAQAAAQLTPCMYMYGTGKLQTYAIDVYTGSLIGNTCPVYVAQGIDIETAGQMAVNATNIGGAASSSNIAGFLYPGAAFGTPAISDPLSWETSPSFSGTCNHTGYSLSNGTATLSPGNYCNGLTLKNSTVTLSAGLYVITGGATWTNSTVSGSGVTLYFTTGGGAGYGPFIIQNTSNVTLSAPTTTTGNGAIAGILVFSDRNWTHTNAHDFYLSQSNVVGDGIWYLTGAGLYINACGTVTGPDYWGVVADNAYITATIVHIMNNYSNNPAGNPFLPPGGLVQ